MTKDFKQIREQNVPTLFNVMAAIEVAKTTPAKQSSKAKGDFAENILAIFKEIKTPLACNQVYAALKAGGMEVTSKQVTNKLWGMAKNGTLKKGEGTGMYELAD